MLVVIVVFLSVSLHLHYLKGLWINESFDFRQMRIYFSFLLRTNDEMRICKESNKIDSVVFFSFASLFVFEMTSLIHTFRRAFIDREN